MALFGKPNAFVGLDIGSSSLKVVELIDRNKRVEVATYASADTVNKLISPDTSPEVIKETADIVKGLLEHGDVAADSVVAALPNSIVFSTVLKLPSLPDDEMGEAVKIAARDIVPANLDELALSWSRVGAEPHSEEDAQEKQPVNVSEAKPKNDISPIFVTAAPLNIIDNYKAVIKAAGLELFALEVETAPLARSLLANKFDSAMIVDIGDAVTTFHIIDQGTPRVSHSVDEGGLMVSQAIAVKLNISATEADQHKKRHGLSNTAPPEVKAAATAAMDKLTNEAKRVLSLYADQEKRQINKTFLIGGGALLKGVAEYWTQSIGHAAVVGNPWKGLSYPDQLEARIRELGPTYAVAVGLAQRGIAASRH